MGSAVSPALANLFLHYALDTWLTRTFPDVEFARYVDDAVVHCRTEARAIQVRDAIAERMRQVGLQLHPDRTRIVYCQDSNRRGSYEHTSFTFLGFTFRQRGARNRRGQPFSGFLPARSDAAQMKMNETVRSWKLHYKTTLTIATSHAGSIRSCGVGCSTTERSTAPNCTRSWNASTPT